MQIVFAGRPADAALIRGMLEDRGIPAELQDDMIGTMAPWYAAPGGAGAVKVVVADEHAQQARELIAASDVERPGNGHALETPTDLAGPASAAERLVDRAFRLAIVGVILLPGLLHLISLFLLARSRAHGSLPEGKTRRRFRFTLIFDVVMTVLSVFGLIQLIDRWF